MPPLALAELPPRQLHIACVTAPGRCKADRSGAPGQNRAGAAKKFPGAATWVARDRSQPLYWLFAKEVV